MRSGDTNGPSPPWGAALALLSKGRSQKLQAGVSRPARCVSHAENLWSSISVAKQAKLAILDGMKSPASKLTAMEAKDGTARVIDLARLSPVTTTKHDRSVVVVLAMEKFERLRAAAGQPTCSPNAGARWKVMCSLAQRGSAVA